MVVIVTGVARLAVRSVRPMGAATRVYGATPQDGVVGMLSVAVRGHGLTAQFGADQCATHRCQISAAPFTELAAHKSANHGAGQHTAQFSLMVVGALDRDLPAVLSSNRRTYAALVVVIVQRRVRRFVRPVTRAVVAAVGSGRRAADRAHGEQDHDADA